MTHFQIEGLPPYDGDYPLKLDDSFTNRELHIIKEISGVRAAELDEAFQAGDNDLIVAFCVIALQRAGRQVDRNRIWDAPIGAIQLVVEEDARPPDEKNNESETEKPVLSGVSSEAGGESQANGQSPTGSQGLVTGADSVPLTSAS